MIQIIKGTFGYYNGRKIVFITEADGPQTFDPELEDELRITLLATGFDKKPGDDDDDVSVREIKSDKVDDVDDISFGKKTVAPKKTTASDGFNLDDFFGDGMIK